MCSKYQERFGFGLLGGEEAALTTQVRQCLNDQVLPRHLAQLEQIAAASQTGWLVRPMACVRILQYMFTYLHTIRIYTCVE